MELESEKRKYHPHITLGRQVLMDIHTDDMIIPYSEGKLIVDSLINTKETKFVSIKRAGHNDIFSFTNEYSSGLKDFVNTIS